MSLRNELLANFPVSIDKSSELFSALITNSKKTGVIEQSLNLLLTYMHSWTNSKSIYEMTGDQLDKTMNFMSYLEKFTDETEESLKARVKAIFKRNGDTKWGTVNNIRNVFRQYFPSAEIFIVENSYEYTKSIIANGDFSDNTHWILLNGAEINKDSRYSGSYGVDLHDGVLSQDVNVQSGSYFIHFFLKGKTKILIRNEENKYWNNKTKDWNIVKTDSITESFNSEEWNNIDLWFISDSTQQITIEFIGEQDAYIDYIRLFKKEIYGSFTVFVHFEANVNNDGALGLFRGNDDPVEDAAVGTYKAAGFYDNSFLTGVAAGFAQDIYNDLLRYVRSVGVQANIEIVTRDYDEE